MLTPMDKICPHYMVASNADAAGSSSVGQCTSDSASAEQCAASATTDQASCQQKTSRAASITCKGKECNYMAPHGKARSHIHNLPEINTHTSEITYAPS